LNYTRKFQKELLYRNKVLRSFNLSTLQRYIFPKALH